MIMRLFEADKDGIKIYDLKVDYTCFKIVIAEFLAILVDKKLLYKTGIKTTNRTIRITSNKNRRG